MITDENEEIEVDGIYYPVRILRQIIRGIKTGCSEQCRTLSALQQFERDRRSEMELTNGIIDQDRRIIEMERKSDD